MNTTILIVSGIIAGLAGALLPRKRRTGTSRPKTRPKPGTRTALESELAPFVDFRN